MSFMVGARLDNNKTVYGIDTKGKAVTYLESPVEIQTATCVPTVVPIFDRFFMRQQGKKAVEHGTLSYGELHFRVHPEGEICG